MAVDRQKEVFDAMGKPDFYPHPVRRIAQRETHISRVFLTGDYAYKIKKPVDLGFLDFTTLKKRRHFCRREVELNRRLTGDVYLDVVPITRKKTRYYLAGPGRRVEYAVRMRQLPEDRSMRILLRSGKIDDRAIRQLSEMLCNFYTQAEVDAGTNPISAWETVCTNCEENFRQTEKFAGEVFDDRLFQIIQRATRSFLKNRKDLFCERMIRGKIRDCHGDLRTGHVYFLDDIQIIDCIEFNDRFRYSDIACDLAFLTMDLDFENQSQVAFELLKAFVQHSNDIHVLALIDFYKCYRAFVRVKVNCLYLQEGHPAAYERNRLLRETGKYLDLSYRYALKIMRPTLWVVCGMIASGKSTIAARLGAVLNADIIQSDVIRKKLFGLDPGSTHDLPFASGIYSEEADLLTYGKLLTEAHVQLKKGCSVILDATFSREHHRGETLRLARNLDADHIFVECTASRAELQKRLLSRKTRSPVSDARLHHLNAHQDRYEPFAPEETNYIGINTEAPVETNIRRILTEAYALQEEHHSVTLRSSPSTALPASISKPYTEVADV